MKPCAQCGLKTSHSHHPGSIHGDLKPTPAKIHAKITYVGDDFQEGLHVVRVGHCVYGPFMSPDQATAFADQHFVGAVVYLHPLRHPDQAAEDANV